MQPGRSGQAASFLKQAPLRRLLGSLLGKAASSVYLKSLQLFDKILGSELNGTSDFKQKIASLSLS